MSGPHRTPRADIYTAMLAIALVAIIIATIFAYVETADYKDKKYQGGPSVVFTTPLDPVAADGNCLVASTTPASQPWAFG